MTTTKVGPDYDKKISCDKFYFFSPQINVQFFTLEQKKKNKKGLVKNIPILAPTPSQYNFGQNSK